MTAIPTYVLVCDTCGAQYRSDPPLRAVMETREVAAGEGWRSRVYVSGHGPAPSNDFCPTCFPAAKSKRRPRRPVVIPGDLAAWILCLVRGYLRRPGQPHADLAKDAVRLLEPRR